MANRSAVYGVGINDSTYKVRLHEKIGDKYRIVWACPIFITWKDLMKRCFSDKYHSKYPTYKEVTLHKPWLSYMNFHEWAKDKDKVGVDLDGKTLQLDKDISNLGNKHYSPETCNFVSPKVNNFLLDGGRERELPLGISFNKKREVYQVFCKDPFDRYTKFIFESENLIDCKGVYLCKKLEYLSDLKSFGYLTDGLEVLVRSNLTERDRLQEGRYELLQTE